MSIVKEEHKIERELLSDKVANLLRRMILSGELPGETRLLEAELSRDLGVSRAPLREALALLDREGLVATTDGQGSFVRSFSEDSIRELFALRSVLEAFAAELAAERITPDEIDHLRTLAKEMREAVQESNAAGYVGVDRQIHQVIWRMSGNRRLISVLEDLISPVETYILINAEHYHDWAEVVDLHLGVIEAIASHDSALAAQTMRAHNKNALQKALNAQRLHRVQAK